jgi:Na+/proline symporter
MVENAYKVTLAGAFVPLFFGAYWPRATTQGALAAIIGGVSSWLLVELMVGEASLVPPQLIGLAASLFGMIVGSLLPQWIGRPTPQEDLHHALHHRAAAETHHVGEHPHRH